MSKQKKIAFCITCMNRLYHLQETLEQNILDNYLPDEVEFVLLDYNSSDDLEIWCRGMQSYLDVGILTYYKTYTPSSYNSSHSKNMVSRLSNAEIICNLDADNYLGKGFAAYIIDKFKDKRLFFYTSNHSVRDVLGRVCVRKEHLNRVRGYNESFVGYGSDDIDLYDRLKRMGLEQRYYTNPEFYNVIRHADTDRISQSSASKRLSQVIISYLKPYETEYVLLYDNAEYERGILINNSLIYYNLRNEVTDITDWCWDERSRVILKNEIEKGTWQKKERHIRLSVGGQLFLSSKEGYYTEDGIYKFYRIADQELCSNLLATITNATNYVHKKMLLRGNLNVNPDGFGKGVVYATLTNNEMRVLD